MGLLSFGGDKSRSSGSSLDFSFGRSGSTAGSTDASSSSAIGGGASSQSIAFEPIFSQLFNNAASRAMGSTESPAKALFSGGLNFLDQLQSNEGTDALASRVSGPNDVLEGNLNTLQEHLGRMFREQINPAITSDAVAGGTLGGGRQGVAQGQGTRAVAEEFTRGASSLISADQQQRDQAASTLAGILTQGAGMGLDNLEGLLAMGVEGQINLAPLSALSNIIGGPTVLTEAQDFSRAFSESLGESFSDSFGENMSYGTSQTRSSSMGFNLGFG